MTRHETLRIDIADAATIELSCKGCRTAITFHLNTWTSVLPARCPNCDQDWYLQDGPVAALRRLCGALKSVRRDTGRPYHARFVLEQPERGDG